VARDGKITVNHLTKNNETYFNHLKFAGTVGLSLIFRGIIFIFHAIVPFFPIPAKWNLESSTKKLQEWNEHAKNRIKGE
jgi:hypothetical protein